MRPLKKLLSRGARLTELLKQPQFTPLSIEKEILAVFAGVNGYLDSININDVLRFEAELFSFVERSPAFRPYVNNLAKELDEHALHTLLQYFVAIEF